MLSNQEARTALKAAKRIALVGISSDAGKTANQIADYLVESGYEVIPVNPLLDEWKGREVYPDVASIPGHIDIVNVFRRPQYLPGVAEDAVRHGDVGMIWNQLGLISRAASDTADAANIAYVEDRCIMVEHRYA